MMVRIIYTTLFVLALTRSDILKADFNCDGKLDKAQVETQGKSAYLIIGSGKKIDTLEFFLVAGDSEDGFCGDAIQAKVENLTLDSSSAVEALAQEIVGYKKSDKCKGIVLEGKNCEDDPIHVFWSHKQKAYSYWRH